MRSAILAAVLLVTATPVLAAESASIPFADMGNIDDWRAEGTESMLIESSRGKWYRVTFFAPCHELPFSETVGFVTEPGGNLTKFSSIIVNGERCRFRTFEEVPAPTRE